MKPTAAQAVRLLSGVTLLALLASSALAQPIRIRATDTAATQPAALPPAAPSLTDSVSVARIALALGVTVALIFLCKYGARRLMPGLQATRPLKSVEVLSRTTLAPRQQLLLIRVGRRLVLVASTGNQFSPVCEITDPDEIAELLGQSRPGAASLDPDSPRATAFAGLFSGAGRAYPDRQVSDQPPLASFQGSDSAQDLRDDDDPTGQPAAAGELSELAQRVRLLNTQFRRP